jgi:hypothetical protein
MVNQIKPNIEKPAKTVLFQFKMTTYMYLDGKIGLPFNA